MMRLVNVTMETSRCEIYPFKPVLIMSHIMRKLIFGFPTRLDINCTTTKEGERLEISYLVMRVRTIYICVTKESVKKGKYKK